MPNSPLIAPRPFNFPLPRQADSRDLRDSGEGQRSPGGVEASRGGAGGGARGGRLRGRRRRLGATPLVRGLSSATFGAGLDTETQQFQHVPPSQVSPSG